MAQTPGARLPALDAEDLHERVVHLPAELPGARTLVLMAYEREQQGDLDTWIEGLHLAEASYPWVEMPVVGAQNAFVRRMIDSGMRRAIRDDAGRSRTLTVFADAAPLRKALGLPDGVDEVDALVLDRDGVVLAHVGGRFTRAKALPLLEVLGR